VVFDETTNYDFILPSKTCQRHLGTRRVNVWDLFQSNQSPSKSCLSLLIFSRSKLII